MVLWTVIIEKTPGVLVKDMRGRGKGMNIEILQKCWIMTVSSPNGRQLLLPLSVIYIPFHDSSCFSLFDPPILPILYLRYQNDGPPSVVTIVPTEDILLITGYGSRRSLKDLFTQRPNTLKPDGYFQSFALTTPTHHNVVGNTNSNDPLRRTKV